MIKDINKKTEVDLRAFDKDIKALGKKLLRENGLRRCADSEALPPQLAADVQVF
jgi:hypothetical protein